MHDRQRSQHFRQAQRSKTIAPSPRNRRVGRVVMKQAVRLLQATGVGANEPGRRGKLVGVPNARPDDRSKEHVVGPPGAVLRHPGGGLCCAQVPPAGGEPSRGNLVISRELGKLREDHRTGHRREADGVANQGLLAAQPRPDLAHDLVAPGVLPSQLGQRQCVRPRHPRDVAHPHRPRVSRCEQPGHREWTPSDSLRYRLSQGRPVGHSDQPVAQLANHRLAVRVARGHVQRLNWPETSRGRQRERSRQCPARTGVVGLPPGPHFESATRADDDDEVWRLIRHPAPHVVGLGSLHRVEVAVDRRETMRRR